MEEFKSPEQVSITTRAAILEDLPILGKFLERPEIDSLFVPPLSDPTSGITIKDRVGKKMEHGMWIIALREGKVVGCMAVVPAKMEKEPHAPKEAKHISLGIFLEGWDKAKLWELSTVVVDKELTKSLRVKGIGKSLFEMAKKWVRDKGGQQGLITDSWIGGEMGGFVMAMNRKDYHLHHPEKKTAPDTLMRIFSDPAKRGEDGPPSVIYGIPLDDIDWQYFEARQSSISDLRHEYERLENEHSK